MKLSTFLLIMATLPTAAIGYGQNSVIKFSEKPQTIVNVIEAIENQSDYKIFYKTDQINVAKPIEINESERTIASLLTTILKGSDISYSMIGKLIVLAPSANINPQKVVTGKVTDAQSGAALPGVNVVLKGTTIGTITDANGKFSLDVAKEGAVLVFSYVGYNTEEIEVNGKSNIDVTLVPNIQSLEEVLVVGYGSMKKRDITGSIASIDEKDYKNQPITNSTEILKGRVAGVSITESSGAPGGDFKIRIRGANSILGGNDPLIVVDGIQGAIGLDDINPKDIESVEILKDASATAIYGSRGANGVILITTKSGSEGPVTVEINSNLSFKRTHNPYAMMDPVLYAETVNLSTGGTAYSPSDIDQLRNTGGYNMYDALLQKGLLQNYEVSVRGGTKATKYSLSGGYNAEDGVMVGTRYKKYTFRSNVTTKVTNKLTVGLNLTATQTAGHNISNTYAELISATTWGPAEKIYNADGTYNMYDPYGASYANPAMLLKEKNQDNSGTAGLIGLTLSYEILPGLIYHSNAGLNMSFSNSGYANNDFYAMAPANGGITGSGRGYSGGSYWQLSNTLTYSKTLSDIHNFTLMAGFEESKSDYSGFNADGNEMATTSVGYDNLSINTVKNFGSYYSGEQLRSYFGRATYSLKNRYLLTTTYRADGSSKFKGDNQYSFFPSVGLGWRLSEEEFIKNLNVFDNLKVRGSWGKTGNQAIGSYGTMSLLTQSNYAWGTTSIYPGYKPYGSSNPDLRWEETTQKDIGLDMSFFKGRLSFTVDAYSKLTSGLLQALSVPLYNGGGSVYGNIGEIENKGFEFLVNAVPVQNKDWRWDVSLNASYTKNNVKSVGDEKMIFPGGTYDSDQKFFVVKPGEPLGTFYGYKWLGIWKTAEAAEAAKYGSKPGDNKFEDYNKDGSIDGLDNQVIGHAVPNWRFGLNTNISYKKFTLNAFIEGVSGGKTYNYVYGMAAVMTSEGRTVTLADGADYWTPTNDNAKFQNILSDTYNAYRNTSQWLQDASYIKLKNISLSYNLSKQKTGIADIKLFVSGQNLFTLTKYKGNDPEATTTGGSDVDSGLDLGIYPTVRSFTAGFTITF